MNNTIKIAVDAMGGDYGPSVTIAGCLLALQKFKNLEVMLFGPTKKLSLFVSNLPKSISNRIVICNAVDEILMSDTAEQALLKTQSSMYLAISAVVSGRADAFVTAGNTVAVTGLSEHLVPLCKGVSKAAFISEIPNVGKPTYMMDLGANLFADAKTLVQYAFMGHFCAEIVSHHKYPKVALLNVGKEDTKGASQVIEAHKYLKRTSLNYHGFIEGNELFDNDVEVVICDGTVGNIALKTAEGAANLMALKIKEALLSSVVTKTMSMPVIPMFKSLKKELDPNKYNGAILLGHTKIIAKSHGGSNAEGFANAIELCVQTSKYNLAKRISDGFLRHDLVNIEQKLAHN